MPPEKPRHILKQFYDALFAHFGPQGWWPGEGRLEICVGAILTQNTNWGNVERAIANIRNADAMNVAALRELSHEQLAALIRPAGYFNVKARRLRNFLDAVTEVAEGDIDRFLDLPGPEMRELLLAINGIGPETADSMMLYAAERPTFVIDAYTLRILRRHRVIDPSAKYQDVRALFQQSLPTEVQMWNEYHALLVAVGKHFCKPRPRCEGCPLERFPHDRPADK
jgi:endonuclease III related protein